MAESLSPNRRPVWPYVLIVVVLAVAVVGFFVVRGITARSTPNPEFPSLADNPDPSLQGTVAYYASDTGCVRVVAASGQPSKDVLCVTGQDREIGPQLAWLPDGRLQVTMFYWTGTPDDLGQFSGAWQKIIDVRTGAVEDLPAAEVPDQPTPATDPAPGPNGERITATSEGGRIEIVLSGPSGSRTLLSAEGNPDYRLAGPPLLSPDRQWVLAQEADEGRLLLVTASEPSQTRVLAAQPGCVGSCTSTGFPISLLAATDTNLLEPAG